MRRILRSLVLVSAILVPAIAFAEPGRGLPQTHAKAQGQDVRSRAQERQERAREVAAERKQHLARLKQLRQERRRLDHAHDKWWKPSIDRQIAGEILRHRRWWDEHRLQPRR